MGTRRKFLGWVPYQGLGTPSFPNRSSMTATVVARMRGPGPARLNSGYGSTHRSIESGAPFGKGTGVFWRAGRSGMKERPADRVCSKQDTTRLVVQIQHLVPTPDRGVISPEAPVPIRALVVQALATASHDCWAGKRREIMADTHTGSRHTAQAEFWNTPATHVWADHNEPIDKLFSGVTEAALKIAVSSGGHSSSYWCQRHGRVDGWRLNAAPYYWTLKFQVYRQFVKGECSWHLYVTALIDLRDEYRIWAPATVR